MDPAETFSQQELLEFQDVFTMFDLNRNGQVTIPDLKTIMCSLGQRVTEDEIWKMLHQINNNYDINENDSVDFNVFLILMTKSRDATAQVLSEEEAKRKAEAEMRHAFQVFDRDGNGLIDSKELRLTMKTLGEKLSKSDVKAMIKAADMNGDGKIDYEEFIQMMYHGK